MSPKTTSEFTPALRDMLDTLLTDLAYREEEALYTHEDVAKTLDVDKKTITALRAHKTREVMKD